MSPFDNPTPIWIVIALFMAGVPAVASGPHGGPGTTDHCDWGGCAEYVAGPGAVVGQLGGIVSLCPDGCNVSDDTPPLPGIGQAYVAGMVPTHNALLYTYDTIYGSNTALSACLLDPSGGCVEGTQTEWVCAGPPLILDSPVASDTVVASIALVRVGETLGVCGASEGTVLADRW